VIEKTVEKSGALFKSGFYCAESVLLAVAEAKGIQSDLIPKIATGFCSGISRTCGQCGAVSGAILSINLFTGRSTPGASVKENYTLVRKLIQRFTEKFGSTNCRDLIHCDLGTDEGQAFFKENHLREACRDYTREATRITMQLLAEI
jgi:C_GCAxxG_C_C family probable redox protein